MKERKGTHDMSKRPPWLNARIKLIALAFIDAVTLATIYNLYFHQAEGRWAGITGSIMTGMIAWSSISYLMGRYSNTNEAEGQTVMRILFSSVLVAAIMAASTVLMGWTIDQTDKRMERDFLLSVYILTGLISAGAQINLKRQGGRTTRWLIIGTKKEVEVMKEEARNCVLLKTNIEYRSENDLTQELLLGFPKCQGLVISNNANLGDEKIEGLLSRRSQGCEINNLVNWAEKYLQRIPPEIFTPRWLVQADGFKLQPNKRTWRLKRLGDIIVTIVLLVLTFPILLVAMLAVYVDNGLPVLYKQVRTGLYGKEFEIIKIRTMKLGSEADGAQWASRKDSRITTVGGWLRKFRIDELPQLLNVIRGDMSLIGPRPERPEIEVGLEKIIPHYRVRNWVRPGISGWAQVCINYGASVEDSRNKLSYDLYYIKNAGPLLDILILIKTVRQVLLARGYMPKERTRRE